MLTNPPLHTIYINLYGSEREVLYNQEKKKKQPNLFLFARFFFYLR